VGRAFCWCWIFLLSLSVGKAVAQPIVPPAPDRGYIADYAGVLTDAHVGEINRMSNDLLLRQGVPIAVLTIRSRHEVQAHTMMIEPYARLVFDQWELGAANRNLGMLIVVAVEDREARIELGAEWQGKADAVADQVMQERMIPHFQVGDYGKGIAEGVRALAAYADGGGLPPKPRHPAFWPRVIAFSCLAIAIVADGIIRRGRSFIGGVFSNITDLPHEIHAAVTDDYEDGLGRRRRLRTRGTTSFWSFFRGGRGSGGGFGGFGGGGFGGGGGATGRW
jgi:uncharacterized protein